jgi:hypothetical protein
MQALIVDTIQHTAQSGNSSMDLAKSSLVGSSAATTGSAAARADSINLGNFMLPAVSRFQQLWQVLVFERQQSTTRFYHRTGMIDRYLIEGK